MRGKGFKVSIDEDSGDTLLVLIEDGQEVDSWRYDGPGLIDEISALLDDEEAVAAFTAVGLTEAEIRAEMGIRRGEALMQDPDWDEEDR